MINVKSILVTALIMMGVTFSNVTLTLTNLDTDAGTVDVYMVNDTAVGGFQFGLAGVNMTGGSGGTSADAGFTVSASSTTLLAFSFTGASIPVGEGVLVTVSFENPDGSVEACIENSVISDSAGGGLEFTEGCIALVEGGGCTDESACNYDADAQFDDGSCDYPTDCTDCDGACTCFEDCSGTCEGTDYSCFTTSNDFVGDWFLEVSYFAEDCTTINENNYVCDDGGDDLYPTMEECETGCSNADDCYFLGEYIPTWVTFNGDGTALVGINTGEACQEDLDCSTDFSYGEAFCNLGECVVTQENFWGIDSDGCFNVWDTFSGPSEEGNTWEVTADGVHVITGIDSELALCEEIQALPAEVG